MFYRVHGKMNSFFTKFFIMSFLGYICNSNEQQNNIKNNQNYGKVILT